MKRTICLILSLIVCMHAFCSPLQTKAASQNLAGTQLVILYSTRSTITGQKEYTQPDNSGNTICKAKLTGSFYFNGVTSNCTASSCDVTIYNNAWSTKSVNSYTSGNSAVAEVTIERKFLFITLETLSFQITLSCDRYGSLS